MTLEVSLGKSIVTAMWTLVLSDCFIYMMGFYKRKNNNNLIIRVLFDPTYWLKIRINKTISIFLRPKFSLPICTTKPRPVKPLPQWGHILSFMCTPCKCFFNFLVLSKSLLQSSHLNLGLSPCLSKYKVINMDWFFFQQGL